MPTLAQIDAAEQRLEAERAERERSGPMSPAARSAYVSLKQRFARDRRAALAEQFSERVDAVRAARAERYQQLGVETEPGRPDTAAVQLDPDKAPADVRSPLMHSVRAAIAGLGSSTVGLVPEGLMAYAAPVEAAVRGGIPLRDTAFYRIGHGMNEFGRRKLIGTSPLHEGTLHDILPRFAGGLLPYFAAGAISPALPVAMGATQGAGSVVEQGVEAGSSNTRTLLSGLGAGAVGGFAGLFPAASTSGRVGAGINSAVRALAARGLLPVAESVAKPVAQFAGGAALGSAVNVPSTLATNALSAVARDEPVTRDAVIPKHPLIEFGAMAAVGGAMHALYTPEGGVLKSAAKRQAKAAETRAEQEKQAQIRAEADATLKAERAQREAQAAAAEAQRLRALAEPPAEGQTVVVRGATSSPGGTKQTSKGEPKESTSRGRGKKATVRSIIPRVDESGVSDPVALVELATKDGSKGEVLAVRLRDLQPVSEDGVDVPEADWRRAQANKPAPPPPETPAAATKLNEPVRPVRVSVDVGGGKRMNGWIVPWENPAQDRSLGSGRTTGPQHDGTHDILFDTGERMRIPAKDVAVERVQPSDPEGAVERVAVARAMDERVLQEKQRQRDIEGFNARKAAEPTADEVARARAPLMDLMKMGDSGLGLLDGLSRNATNPAVRVAAQELADTLRAQGAKIPKATKPGAPAVAAAAEAQRTAPRSKTRVARPERMDPAEHERQLVDAQMLQWEKEGRAPGLVAGLRSSPDPIVRAAARKLYEKQRAEAAAAGKPLPAARPRFAKPTDPADRTVESGGPTSKPVKLAAADEPTAKGGVERVAQDVGAKRVPGDEHAAELPDDGGHVALVPADEHAPPLPEPDKATELAARRERERRESEPPTRFRVDPRPDGTPVGSRLDENGVRRIHDLLDRLVGRAFAREFVAGITTPEGQRAGGSQQGRMIRIALDQDVASGLRVAGHEAGHFFLESPDSKLPKGARNVWRAKAQRIARARLGKGATAQDVEEIAAEMLADHLEGKRLGLRSPWEAPVRAALDAAWDFLYTLREALRGNGWRRVEDVFGDIEAGRYQVDTEPTPTPSSPYGEETVAPERTFYSVRDSIRHALGLPARTPQEARERFRGLGLIPHLARTSRASLLKLGLDGMKLWRATGREFLRRDQLRGRFDVIMRDAALRVAETSDKKTVNAMLDAAFRHVIEGTDIPQAIADTDARIAALRQPTPGENPATGPRRRERTIANLQRDKQSLLLAEEALGGARSGINPDHLFEQGQWGRGDHAEIGPPTSRMDVVFLGRANGVTQYEAWDPTANNGHGEWVQRRMPDAAWDREAGPPPRQLRANPFSPRHAALQDFVAAWRKADDEARDAWLELAGELGAGKVHNHSPWRTSREIARALRSGRRLDIVEDLVARLEQDVIERQLARGSSYEDAEAMAVAEAKRYIMGETMVERGAMTDSMAKEARFGPFERPRRVFPGHSALDNSADVIDSYAEGIGTAIATFEMFGRRIADPQAQGGLRRGASGRVLMQRFPDDHPQRELRGQIIRPEHVVRRLVENIGLRHGQTAAEFAEAYWNETQGRVHVSALDRPATRVMKAASNFIYGSKLLAPTLLAGQAVQPLAHGTYRYGFRNTLRTYAMLFSEAGRNTLRREAALAGASADIGHSTEFSQFIEHTQAPSAVEHALERYAQGFWTHPFRSLEHWNNVVTARMGALHMEQLARDLVSGRNPREAARLLRKWGGLEGSDISFLRANRGMSERGQLPGESNADYAAYRERLHDIHGKVRRAAAVRTNFRGGAEMAAPWMHGTMGQFLKVFRTFAYHTSRTVWDDVVVEAVKHKNLKPALRWLPANLAVGGALKYLYDKVFGNEDAASLSFDSSAARILHRGVTNIAIAGSLGVFERPLDFLDPAQAPMYSLGRHVADAGLAILDRPGSAATWQHAATELMLQEISILRGTAKAAANINTQFGATGGWSEYTNAVNRGRALTREFHTWEQRMAGGPASKKRVTGPEPRYAPEMDDIASKLGSGKIGAAVDAYIDARLAMLEEIGDLDEVDKKLAAGLRARAPLGVSEDDTLKFMLWADERGRDVTDLVVAHHAYTQLVDGLTGKKKD